MFLCSRLRCVGRNFLDYWRGSAAQKIWRMSQLVWVGSTTDMTLRHHMTEMCQEIRFGDQTSTEIKIWRTLWRVFEVVWISFDTVCRLWSETIWRRLYRGTYWRRHEISRLASELTWKEEVDDDTHSEWSTRLIVSSWRNSFVTSDIRKELGIRSSWAVYKNPVYDRWILDELP